MKHYIASVNAEPNTIFLITILFLTLFLISGIRQAVKNSE